MSAKPDLSIFCRRAQGFVANGQFTDALGLYDDVLSVDSSCALAYAQRGTTYAMLKKFKLAIQDLAKAIALNHADAATYNTLATIQLAQADYPAALENFGAAIAAEPDYPLSYYNRSALFLKIARKADAVHDLQKFLGYQPEPELAGLARKRLSLAEA